MPLDLNVEDHIAVLTINNPPLNLWSSAMSERLIEALDSFMGNHDVRVVVLTGVGDRAFTGGHDLNEAAAGTGGVSSFRQARVDLQAMQDCPVPIVGAVNGYALGHGLAMCSGCDILIASEKAKFGVPEVKVGRSNGQRMMRELFPKGHARYAYFTGEFIDAEEAHRVGAVFRVVPHEQLMTEAMSIARTIARNSPTSIRLFKDTVRWTDSMDLQTGYRYEGERARSAREDPAYLKNEREAWAAFRDKREPNYE